MAYQVGGYDRRGQSVAEHYGSTKRGAIKRGLEFNLTKQQFAALVSKPCVYGALLGSASVKVGLDRKDNGKGYVVSNCVPCCDRHNRVKTDVFTYAQMLDICARYQVQCGPALSGRKKMPRQSQPIVRAYRRVTAAMSDLPYACRAVLLCHPSQAVSQSL